MNAYSVPSFTILGENFVLVRNPVFVPSMKGSRVYCRKLPISAARSNSDKEVGNDEQCTPRTSTLVTSNPAFSSLPITQLSAQEASAPGKTYLFMNKPLVTFNPDPISLNSSVRSESE